eukprot:CAMPEP_0172532762 /NCGR_PEP_ID=MMETSP1067-20121228/5696_1 /TAXON_ID=265564 ORGANISM="Thalassiosira punctigera, Strain Tpunct2005C2" /NCGR_SAMPLE_ID=MMETSP1067 /ASSEMBLY_ACC=CAM_ASM_000444 /LENGTH=387 /DNA_ID=CAMNT_0013317315 /DNA_START=224 /DNA_END=1383 /DNA_ORIENTATION=-
MIRGGAQPVDLAESTETIAPPPPKPVPNLHALNVEGRVPLASVQPLLDALMVLRGFPRQADPKRVDRTVLPRPSNPLVPGPHDGASVSDVINFAGTIDQFVQPRHLEGGEVRWPDPSQVPLHPCAAQSHPSQPQQVPQVQKISRHGRAPGNVNSCEARGVGMVHGYIVQLSHQARIVDTSQVNEKRQVPQVRKRPLHALVAMQIQVRQVSQGVAVAAQQRREPKAQVRAVPTGEALQIRKGDARHREVVLVDPSGVGLLVEADPPDLVSEAPRDGGKEPDIAALEDDLLVHPYARRDFLPGRGHEAARHELAQRQERQRSGEDVAVEASAHDRHGIVFVVGVGLIILVAVAFSHVILQARHFGDHASKPTLSHFAPSNLIRCTSSSA